MRCGPASGAQFSYRSGFGHNRPFDIAGWIADNAAVDDVEIERMDKHRAFLLPFGIDLRVEDGIASIESNLPEALPSFSDPMENGRIVGVIEGVEQLLLSLARVGIDLSNPQFAQAIHDCVANLHSA
ncbi:hypothetical protein BJG93_32720 (plasmid) [Paraburkholderia sprentiae WSM5005]|uniref:Uncharacterized protein n=1 Tax=Paraburkholderia sprentiae WSM5005 TaxID=754502 RepID=A0ACA8AXA7_9BURK|nr:hypothetical protein BJG93_32720 [Paraburkholderia sprentiae WSM5005]